MATSNILKWVQLLPEHSPKLSAMRADVVELLASAGSASGDAAAKREQIAALQAKHRLELAPLLEAAAEHDRQAADLRQAAYFAACAVEASAKETWSVAAIEEAKRKA